MRTTDCSTLETLIENHELVDLIDIRPKKEFDAMHILGARSLPLAELSQPHLFRRNTPMAGRVYIISDNRGSGSLAAGILRASGEIDAVVLDGGMKAWVGKGFPVLHAASSLKLSTLLRAAAVALGIVAGVAFAMNQILAAVLVLVSAATLLLKAGLVASRLTRRTTRSIPTKPCPA
jgi:rhodanese-related sulfurtransferase